MNDNDNNNSNEIQEARDTLHSGEVSNDINEFHEALNAYVPGTKGLTVDESESYIQDQNSDKVLLNNCTRRKTSRRASAIENSTPSNMAQRGSVLTTASHTASFDAATLEIQRMRTSILNKREKKKQKTLPDDDNVLVGNKVDEGHGNYVVAYNMLTGIRVSVSRCSGIRKPLADQDFKACKKLVFDVSGNELTPSSKYDFKFKDYAPEVFRDLRLTFGLDPADYLMSLTSKYILSEMNSPGKSGSFFYYSRDYRFIIKTIHHSEHRLLRKILREYHSHIKENPNTLICQFYGLHRLKMPIYYGKRRKIYFIVMNNLFPPHRDIHRTFDLKGSTLGRLTVPKEDKHVVFKDLNWIEEKKVIRFGPATLNVFIEQLRKDVQLLIKLRIMDYSFLIGFHDLVPTSADTNIQQKNLSIFSPPSSNMRDLKNTNPQNLNRTDDIPAIEYHGANFFHATEGGIVATGPDDEPLSEMYYFGIIDCLTHYSVIKRLETFWRSLTNDRKVISSVPPEEYGRRFLEFVEHSINENTLLQEKSKND